MGSRSRLDRGGYYQKAFNDIVVGGIPHGAETDPFCKSVPFWQMYLYSKKVSDNPYLYEDLHEQIRREVDPTENKNGTCQLNFVESAAILCRWISRPISRHGDFERSGSGDR